MSKLLLKMFVNVIFILYEFDFASGSRPGVLLARNYKKKASFQQGQHYMYA